MSLDILVEAACAIYDSLPPVNFLYDLYREMISHPAFADSRLGAEVIMVWGHNVSGNVVYVRDMACFEFEGQLAGYAAGRVRYSDKVKFRFNSIMELCDLFRSVPLKNCM
jgi:hypothetical protein